MIEFRVGDLLKQEDIEVIIHQCNCFCNMGKGIALQIKNTYPEAYIADCKTKIGDPDKMGTYTVAIVDNGKKMVVNMYSQYNYGYKMSNSQAKYTDYDSMTKALEKFIEDYCISTFETTGKPLICGMPFRIGCDLGGGDWEIVLYMLKRKFRYDHVDDKSLKLVICEFHP
jgi:hypothetical protein